jgi:hypothetical protein
MTRYYGGELGVIVHFRGWDGNVYRGVRQLVFIDRCFGNRIRTAQKCEGGDGE